MRIFNLSILLATVALCPFQISQLKAEKTNQFFATRQEITPVILRKMPYTWNNECPVPLADLRYITVSHYDFAGNIHQGELVVHKLLVDDLIDIFEKL